jgi:hypothetical protein
MHDRHGNQLNKGDIVLVQCAIIGLATTDEFCNVDLETVYGRRPDDKKERISTVNTACVELQSAYNDLNGVKSQSPDDAVAFLQGLENQPYISAVNDVASLDGEFDIKSLRAVLTLLESSTSFDTSDNDSE